MAKLIKNLNISGKKPTPGGIVSIEAQWFLDTDRLIGVLSRAEIIGVLRATASKVKLAISRSVERAYRASGLRRVSGKLIADALRNFEVRIDLVGTPAFAVEVRAIWRAPNIAYFFAQLFGRPEINLPAHDFIVFDRTAGREIQTIFNEVLTVRFQAAKDRIRRSKPKRASPARPSPFRARKLLRQAGVNPSLARAFVSSQLASGVSIGRITEQAQVPDLVDQIKRGFRVKISRRL